MTAPSSKPGCKSGCLLLLQLGGIAAIAIAIGVIATECSNKKVQTQIQRGEEADKEFASFVPAKTPPADAIDDAQARYRTGHLFVINGRDGMVDATFFDLPTTLRAANEKDVGTEVWLNWDSKVVGKYGNGGDAYKTNCDIVVYDVARKAIVAREHIEGDDPPSTVVNPKGSKEGWIKAPTDKVLKFLQDLPAR
jgi:hypothetical protein